MVKVRLDKGSKYRVTSVTSKTSSQKIRATIIKIEGWLNGELSRSGVYAYRLYLHQKQREYEAKLPLAIEREEKLILASQQAKLKETERIIKTREKEALKHADTIAIARRALGKTRQIPLALKSQVIDENNIKFEGKCPYCSNLISTNRGHIDHIYPIIMGGLTKIENLLYVCSQCNLKKSSSTLMEFCVSTSGLDFEILSKELNAVGKRF